MEQGGGIVIEPLPELLSCVQRCLLLHLKQGAAGAGASAQQSMGSTDVFKRTSFMLNKLALALQTSEPADFELDKATDFDKTTQRGKTKLTIAAQLVAAHESCMDFLLLSQPIGQGSVQQLLNLFAKHNELWALNSGGGKKKGKGQAKAKAAPSETFRVPSYPSSASLAGMHRLLSLLQGIYDVDQDERETIATILGDDEKDGLRKYALATTHALLTAVCRGNNHMSDPGAINSQVKKCIDLSPRLLFDFELMSTAYEEADKADQPGLKRQRDKAMECLRMVVQITTAQKCSAQVVRLLDALFEVVATPHGQRAGAAAADADAPVSTTDSAAISAKMAKLQRLFKQQAEDSVWQPAYELLEILDSLSSHLHADDLKHHAQWAVSMCGLRGKMTSRVAGKLTSVLLKWHQSSLEAASKLALSARTVYGHAYESEEDEEEQEAALAFATGTTVDAIALVLLDHLSAEVSFVEYVTKKMLGAVPKPSVTRSMDDEDGASTAKLDEAKAVLPLRHCNLVAVSKRLTQIVEPLSLLAESNLPSPRSSAKSPSEQLVVLLQRLYPLLQLLCKEFSVMPEPTGMPSHLSALLSALQELGSHVNQSLGSLAGTLAGSDDEEERPEKKKGKASAAAVAKTKKTLLAKQAKQIPKLVFHMEKFDVALMRLQKCWSDVDFRVYSVTSGVSRDYRFNMVDVAKTLKSRARQERKEDTKGSKSKKRKRSSSSSSSSSGGGGGAKRSSVEGAATMRGAEEQEEVEDDDGQEEVEDLDVTDDEAEQRDDESDDDSIRDMIVADGEGETSDSGSSSSDSDTDSD